MRWKTILSLFIFLLFISINVNCIYPNLALSDSFLVDVNLSLLKEVNWKNIEDHIYYLSSLGSRVTGYPGCDLAAEYIANKFREYGLRVDIHEFNVTVPIDYGASLTFLEYPWLNLRIYPLIPNLVVTNTVKNLTAPIVYIGDGDFKYMDGKKIEGSIVLMDFNSHGRLPAKFGAKAVIYVEPNITTKEEIDQLIINLPMYFPRFYISKEDFTKLKQLLDNTDKPIIACINSNQRWETRIGKNIIGKLEGAMYPNRTMILSTFYDSYSIVPSIAPGANDAAGIASLLEIARIFSRLPKPDYTILFIAWSGHYQGLAGSRTFVEDIVWNRIQPSRNNIGERYTKLEIGLWVERVINLGLTTRSCIWALTDIGDFYGHTVPPATPASTGNIYLYDYIKLITDEISRKTGEVYIVENAHTYSSPAAIGTVAVGTMSLPVRRVFPRGLLPWDHEPFTEDGLAMAFTLATVDPMQYAFNPIDTVETVNLQNLRRQLEAIIPVIYDFLFKPNNFVNYLKKTGRYLEPPYPPYVNRNSFTALGTVAAYNKTLAWYSPIPYSLVVIRRFFPIGEYWENQRPLIVMTDGNGRFRVPMLQTSQTIFMAYKINPETGTIEYGPDMGIYEYVALRPVEEWVIRSKGLLCDFGFLTVFKCGTAVLYDFIDPETASIAGIIRSIEVLDALGDAPTDSFGYIIEGKDAVVFTPTDTNVKIVLRINRFGRIPVGVLLNNSEQFPLGVGYRFETNHQYVFINTPLQIAKNFLHLISQYYSEIFIHGIITSISVETLKEHIKEVEMLFEGAYYSKAYYESLKLWQKILKNYIEIRNVKIDIVNSIPFLSLLLVFFVFLFQQLVIPTYGPKRIASLIFIFLLFLGSLFYLHPGFLIASNSLMLIVSLMVIILASPSIGVIASSISWHIKKITGRIKGLHTIEKGRTSLISLSFSLGIENMRKRKARAILTIITITLVVMSLVTFTSISLFSVLTYQKLPFKPPYTGVFIKQREWVYPLDRSFVESFIATLRSDKDIIIVPRAVLYTSHPAAVNPDVPYIIRNSETPNKSIAAYAVLSLPYEAIHIFDQLATSIIEGRWFEPGDKWVCILSNEMATKLNITISGKVMFYGKEFRVIGIVDSKIFDNIWDLNVQAITPWDARIPEQDFIHVGIKETLIIDYESVLYFNPQIACISVKFENPERCIPFFLELFNNFPHLEIIGGLNNETYVISAEKAIKVHGIEMQFILLAISSLILLNIIIGSIYERRRDIYVLSTVGASPLQVAITFLSEMVTYSIVSGMIGYILATLLVKFLSLIGANLIMNYASVWVIMSMLIALLAVIVPVSYSLKVASALVTPSLERIWRVPTKPINDMWDIPLPFVFIKEEIDGICSYLIEYLEAHLGEGAVDFSIKNLTYMERIEDYVHNKIISFISHLTPYELGVIQHVNIVFNLPKDSERWHAYLRLSRVAGPRDVWEKNNYKFIDLLRKEFLLWRSLKFEEKIKYVEKFINYKSKLWTGG